MRKTILLVSALVLVAFSAGAVVASVFVPPTTVKGKAIRQVKVVRNGSPQTFTDDGGATVFTDIDGASTNVKIPSGSKGTLLIRFSGESNCWGGSDPGGMDNCYVQVLIDGNVAEPGPVQFDTNNANTESYSSYEAHAMEWSSERLGSGAHTVQVQVRVDESLCCPVTFALNHWTLAVEQAA